MLLLLGPSASSGGRGGIGRGGNGCSGRDGCASGVGFVVVVVVVATAAGVLIREVFKYVNAGSSSTCSAGIAGFGVIRRNGGGDGSGIEECRTGRRWRRRRLRLLP